LKGGGEEENNIVGVKSTRFISTVIGKTKNRKTKKFTLTIGLSCGLQQAREE
jgi:hypothetical protein